MVQVGTLALWLGCLAIGGLGLAFPYARPQLKIAPVEVPPAEAIKVELSNDPLPRPADSTPAPSSTVPPAAPPMASATPAAALTPVAEPSPAIAFSVPVQGPVQIVDPSQAAHGSPATQSSETAPAVVGVPGDGSNLVAETLTFGQGEGRQPAPEYPYRARQEGQQSPVSIRFTVGETGRVIAAESLPGCPWPLLNEAALKVVRERWRFRTGPLRRYDVVIRFEIHR
jgi:protein TonB